MELKHIRYSAVALLLACIPFSAYAAKTSYTFGFVPQQSASKLSKIWTPALKYISDKSGVKLRFATSRNIPSFAKRMSKGKYDFIYSNPYHYTQYQEDAEYEAFARAKNKKLKGILVVPKDSPVKSLEELDGQTLAFPSPAAFAASILPRAEFNSLGKSIKTKYMKSHDSVYRNVSKGRYPAGGGVMRTFRNASPKIRKSLRVLWTSKGYTPHPFAAHSRVPDEDVQKVLQAMLDMDKDPKGRALLKKVRIKGIEAGSDRDWDDVRSLKFKDMD